LPKPLHDLRLNKNVELNRFAESFGNSLLKLGEHAMKTFFVLLLLVSIIFPVYSFMVTIGDFAHNQYAMRLERLEGTTPETSPSVHLGLTKMELSKLDEAVRASYDAAVRDGYRLGRGYNKLCLQSLGLDVLLFVASIVGLTKLRTLKETQK
jgi:hypothetical protein